MKRIKKKYCRRIIAGKQATEKKKDSNKIQKEERWFSIEMKILET